jgi:cell wall assembly regulator SMI1
LIVDSLKIERFMALTRAAIHQAFVSEFHEGETPKPTSADDIQRIEEELGTVLPRSYIAFMQTHGSVHTPSLLALIVDGEEDQWDVLVISEAAEVIEGTTSYWSAGMSEKLVGFASDSMGNLFCFQRVPAGSVHADDSEVWFFDHDYCTDRKIADGFDEWLSSYLKLKEAT